jgi:hypothetical protein
MRAQDGQVAALMDEDRVAAQHRLTFAPPQLGQLEPWGAGMPMVGQVQIVVEEEQAER